MTKRPESVLVVIYTRAGEVLLMRRVRPAAFWQSVTGSMEWNETEPLSTARRELAEETGISGERDLIDCHTTNTFPIKPAWRHRYRAGVRQNTEHVFKLLLPERVPVVLNRAEHSEYVWLPRAGALEQVTSYTNRDAILQHVPAGE